MKKLNKYKLSTRHAFVAPEGYVFGSFDFKSQEIRCAGALSKDPNITNVYKLEKDYLKGIISLPKDPDGNEYEDPKIDPHIVSSSNLSDEVRSLLINAPWQCNKHNPLVATYRQLGKILSFSLIYGAQAANIASQTGRTPGEAQQLIDKYFNYPDGFYGLGAWLKTIAAMASETRWTRTATRAMINVGESNAKGLSDLGTTARKASNAAVQGTAAEQSKLAAVMLDKQLQEMDEKHKVALAGRRSRFIGLIHDKSCRD